MYYKHLFVSKILERVPIFFYFNFTIEKNLNLKKSFKYPSQLSEQNVVSIVRSVLLTAKCDGTLVHLQYMLVIIDF